ncbi:MAG: T9SS type A sorting domain-containing protein [Candidatus Latescibacterota bacterium]
MPAQDQEVYGDAVGVGWTVEPSRSTTVDWASAAQVHSGTSALAVTSRTGFSIRLVPAVPFDPTGWSLHFALHPADTQSGTRPTVNLQTNGTSDMLNLAAQGARQPGLDVGLPEWQTVDVPLSFTSAPIAQIHLMGNLRGTFYLDDLRLLAARPSGVPATAVTEEQGGAPLPAAFGLAQNYPNPFNAETVIPFALAERAHVRLTVHDLLGQVVARLVDGVLPAGPHQVRWDASGQASGLYLVRLQAGGFVRQGRAVVVR